MIYASIRTHHLLDHKPDNLLRTGHKHQLVGFYKFGTPGIAVLFASHRNYLENFLDTLKSNMPQKKFQIVWERDWESGSSVSGWNEMSTASNLKEALAATGAPPEDYFTILGLEAPTQESAQAGGGKSGKGKKGKGKKK